ncbi:TatA/E family twin arginine-targeting protein translocase [Prochlorococcus marinus]|uniref:Sec-independent protein translocase protein TatA n=1 Tax=Prochlorococcus marinus (strain MIT 9211) TaxID=93059 RepID=A9BDM1_PROM4|nr:TatA/E family twin arginine-targeting protein translocase [Prochlorococcus marinus]ABX08207.1 Sec-independent protein secretion pathway component [Prochlorococcus marinus str. MIT 9211]
MNIFGVGLPEIAVIVGLALVIFGPKRLPELGRTLGKTLKGLQKASTEFESEIQKAMTEPDNSESATKEGADNQGDSLIQNKID